ncbi:Ser/Thr protein kinase RdoA (MazF antagonist) [Dysgonomonas hofstadii]|uniref:Ser/Thr protein kinase RdoA (MazF antagonist) n=1 Tax=Dysgonomonas hofstadii TaxID=637886 RepID=A0A840CY43_9BACT|nr:aminoglycoside phosphotransferase family protein [Dysgonomonas hofstadii]MBB4037675.1 Ser/Thr protein kinase RdoA (MazF antagonist) [Dysgonomonas hofstadii]
MKKSKEWTIVKELTNVADENSIVLNEVGWTSRVYIVNNGEIVLKFLKDKQYKEEFEHEINILRLIKEHQFNVNIPLISSSGEDNTYIVFNGLMGKSMTTKFIDILTKEEKRKIGIQIGLFLKTLHTIAYKGKSPNSENDIFEWFQKSFNKRKNTLKKHFHENELVTIENLVTTLPQKSQKLGIEQVFCHGDLGYNNILLTDSLEVGVIDFGDAGYNDKSYDFVGLEDDDILDAAILAYDGDEILKAKVEIRRQLLPLMEMLFLIDKKDKEGVIQCVEKMRINLKTYDL